MTGLPCPNCGSELALLEQYRRHYCYACGQYAPQGFGDEGAKICPSCGGILSYVTEYNRYYCYRESKFPAEEADLKSIYDAVSNPPTQEASTAPTVLLTEPPKVEKPAARVVEPPEEPVQEHAPLAEEEIPPDEPAPKRPTQPLNRVKIFQAKKTTLLDLCKDYNLDPTGTKEQLRERLLSYLDTLEAEAQPKEIPEEEVSAQQGPPPMEEMPAKESETEAATAEVPDDRVVAEESPEEEAATEVPTPAVAVASAVVETDEPTQAVVETFSAASAVTPSEMQPSVASASVYQQARTIHPCPTCGRELTYIALYRRWYCYHCRAYAPVSTSKFACPNCGAALRWIAQYERWWCDACRRYAPADLPKPEAEAESVSAVVARPAAQVATLSTATVVHRHRSPGSGISLVGFGVMLFVLYEVLVDLPSVLSYQTGIAVAPNLAFGLRFFAFVLVAVGAIMGLSAVRDRR